MGANPRAGEPLVVVKGGLSPDRRYAVAVVPSKPGEFLDEADTRVFLLDGRTHRKIGPLEEVDASGGGAAGASTTQNVRAAWSPDGRYLAVNYSIGHGGDGQLYRLSGRRAFPVKLPDPKDHPKGKMLAVLFTSSHNGREFRWQDNQTLIELNWKHPFKPDSTGEEESRYRREYGLPADFEGMLEYVYKLKRLDEWSIADIRPAQQQ